jgi:curli biogenesis system outer membrane secretion channel CsgG
MTTARIVACVIALTPLALTGCPGKSASTAGGHDAAFYNTHLTERRVTLDRCNKLDPATQAADIDCQAAVYSSMYGPSQLKAPASP